MRGRRRKPAGSRSSGACVVTCASSATRGGSMRPRTDGSTASPRAACSNRSPTWTSSCAPPAYLTGYLAGKRASAKGVTEAILDLGLQRPSKGGRLFAALQGLLDSGVSVPHSPEVLPSKERIRGAHIGESIPTQFDAVKSKLEAP